MEKYSNAQNDFVKAIKEVEDNIEDTLIDKKNPARTVARTAKFLANPSAIPTKILTMTMAKESTGVTEDIKVLLLRDTLMENFGTDWIHWLPEVASKTLFEGQRSQILENKIAALVTCLSTDTPWDEWHIFENVGKAFNHQVPNFGLIQPLSVGECAVTMEVMEQLRDENFSNEVLIYVATCAANENYVFLPTEWQIGQAQERLDSFTYDPWLKEAVKKKWDLIKNHPNLITVETNDDDPVEVQLGKLIVLDQYFKENV